MGKLSLVSLFIFGFVSGTVLATNSGPQLNPGWVEDLELSEGFGEPTWGTLSIQGRVCTTATKAILTADVAQSCGQMRRALYLMENYYPQIRAMFDRGINFSVYFANRRFFEDRVRRRVRACDTGKIYLKCVGRCGTERETVAYVLVTLGWVHSTINICDEYFDQAPMSRASTMSHEYGRLEDIGDSPDFDTNNIYVWDAIIGNLSNERTYQAIIDSAQGTSHSR